MNDRQYLADNINFSTYYDTDAYFLIGEPNNVPSILPTIVLLAPPKYSTAPSPHHTLALN